MNKPTQLWQWYWIGWRGKPAYVYCCDWGIQVTGGLALRELTSPCSILLRLSAPLGCGKYQFYKSSDWFGWDSISRSSTWEACALLIRQWKMECVVLIMCIVRIIWIVYRTRIRCNWELKPQSHNCCDRLWPFCDQKIGLVAKRLQVQFEWLQGCVFRELVSLYSCLCTIRERYRSQKCDKGGTLLLTSGLVRYEAVLHSCGTSPMGG